jgi:hypothetical protein
VSLGLLCQSCGNEMELEKPLMADHMGRPVLLCDPCEDIVVEERAKLYCDEKSND